MFGITPSAACLLRGATCLFAALTSLYFTTPSAAQNVAAQLSTREAYVGQAIILQIQIANASQYDRPSMPELDGLKIDAAGTPSRSSQISILNGRTREQTTITYQYRITPRREGTFTIPPIEVAVNGRTQRTRAFQFVVSRSETGDLMFVEVTGQKDKVYVGQPIQLTLKIWIRPFTDRARELKLSEANMWQLISDSTDWGVFQERLKELAEEKQRPGGEEVLRTDSNGNQRAYYLYEVEAMVYPQRPGQIDIGDTQIVVDYPTALGESRSRFPSVFDDDDFFGGSLFNDMLRDSPFNRRSLQVTSSRPIVAKAALPPVSVIDVPVENRPSGYRGAVGKYLIGAQAKPVNVKVGDPITLQIVLQGDGPMELVQAPPIGSLEKLTRDFKVANDDLAGFVQDDAKLFTTSLRPRRESVTEIPPIPFSFFNPDTASFETVYSKPIPVTVEKADSLSLDAIVGTTRENRSSQTDGPNDALTSEAKGPVLTNYSVDQILSHLDQEPGAPWYVAYTFAIPPALFVVSLLISKREWISRCVLFSRGPFAEAISSVRKAQSPSVIATAIQNAIGQTDTQVASDLIRRCNEAAYSPLTSEPLDSLKESALEVLRERSRARHERSDNPTSTAGAITSLLLSVAIWLLISRGASADDVLASLSPNQQSTILTEANDLYAQANEVSSRDTPTSKELLEQAINKYQLIADDGTRSSKLSFNLGNAHLQLGDLGRAIANFEQAQRLCPQDQTIASNLRFARQQLVADAGEDVPEALDGSAVWRRMVDLNKRIPPHGSWLAAVVSWSTVWVLASLRVFWRDMRFFRSLFVCSLAFCLVATASIAITQREMRLFDGITIAKSAELHEADGESFPVVGKVDLGQRVKLLEQRGDWLRIKTKEHSVTGWLLKKQVQRIDGET